MKLIVCPLSQAASLVTAHAPERVVSLLDPDFEFPELGPAYADRHLRLHFHDVHDDGAGQLAPQPKHVETLLAFLSQWSRFAPMLIHCRAGIGRSTATAFIAACIHNPDIDERTLALELRQASPLARPNQVLVALADAAMERNGRMIEAIVDTGRDLEWHGIDENVAFEMPARFGQPRRA